VKLLGATGHHLPYGITQTCHPTQESLPIFLTIGTDSIKQQKAIKLISKCQWDLL